MKSNRIWGWLAVVSVVALGACGGQSKIGTGNGDDDPKGSATAGTKNKGNDPGKATAGTDMGKGDPDPGEETGTAGTGMGTGGSDMGTGGTGMGTAGGMSDPGAGAAPHGQGPCMGPLDCSNNYCETCADGQQLCHKSECNLKTGLCADDHQRCAAKCGNNMDCQALNECSDCGDGKTSCTTAKCDMQSGYCSTSTVGCTPPADLCKDAPCGNMCIGGYCDGYGKCLKEQPKCAAECKVAMDCGAPQTCTKCGDGSCAKFDCAGGKCSLACPIVEGLLCKYTEECPVRDDCQMCPNGKCAVEACLMNTCQAVCPL